MSEGSGSAESGDGARLPLRPLAVGVFLPHSAMAIGQGATAPVIALLARELGASVAGAALIVAMFGLGAFFADVPAGVITSRIGDRHTMMLASGVMAATSMGVVFRPHLIVFGGLVAVMGAATAVFGIARLAYATELSPLNRRGRVMSSIGGVQRIGLFIGPILGGLAIAATGLTGPYLIHSVMASVAFVLVRFARRSEGPSLPTRISKRPTVVEIVRTHRRILTTAGAATVAIQVVRSSRQVLIPLWGEQIGLDPSQISLLFSLSAGMEILMFYPVGRLMDRKGRKWAAIPALGLMSLGIAGIPLTSSAVGLSIVAAVLGFANGMSTGINMTLSSDFSPTSGRSVFLGVWRMIADAGTAGGPTLVAAMAALTGLAFASMTVATAGIGGVFVLWLAVPEPLNREEP